VFVFIERIWQDLRHGWRVFAKNPGVTAIAVVSIALGTGANVAVFGAADALILRPLPVSRPSDLLTVGSPLHVGRWNDNAASYPDYVDIRDRNQSFEGLAAFTSRAVGFSAHPGAPLQVKTATVVTWNFFRVLGIEPPIGRGFLPEEDQVVGRDAVAVLTYGVWQQEFGGDRSVLGRKVRLAAIDFTIVGVAPESFTGIQPPFIRDAVYVPMAMWPRVMRTDGIDPLASRDFRRLTVKGRLKPGATLAEARAELAVIARDLAGAYPDTNRDQALIAQTELEMRFETSPLASGAVMLWTILSVAVLCVACANVAGLLASRAPARSREIAVRMAIGAGRARLVRQLITESLGIALVGGIGGVAVGYAGIVLLRRLEFPTDIIGPPVFQLDGRSLTFSLALAMASALLFGLGPAIQTTRVDLVHSLKASEASAGRRQRLTGRHLLVAVQVALSLVLLTIAVFAAQVFRRQFVEGPGWRTSRMARLTIDPGQARYSETQAARFFEQVAGEARRLPGVRSVGLTSAMPLFGNFEFPSIAPEGFVLPAAQDGVRPWAASIDESYFETMEIPVLAGRAFRTTDTLDAPRVAIVNDTFARHYWPGLDAVGRRFRLNDEGGRWVEVVGVVKTTTVTYSGEAPQDAIYFSFRQQPRTNMALVAQTVGDSTTALAPLREMVRRIDADVPTYDVQTIEVFFDAHGAVWPRIATRLIVGLGVMGMALTVVGLYGLVSYAVSRRTREIGIRIAIGASQARVLAMVLRQGLTPAWCGMVAGLGLSVVTARLLPALVQITDSFDARNLWLVVPLLLAVTLLAALVPARRAARVEPTVALRYE
jgi:putative ABC transport system permease protein